jgi:hypothetical protein
VTTETAVRALTYRLRHQQIVTYFIIVTHIILSAQVDSSAVESKIYPRAAALAERLWSNPQEKWYKAEQRMLQQRWRLTHRGINADTLQPEWCRLNAGQCYWKDDKPTP